MERKRINVIELKDRDGIPSGTNIFYLCLICRSVIPSHPDDYTKCKCGNVSVDVEAARGGAKDILNMIVLEIV